MFSGMDRVKGLVIALGTFATIFCRISRVGMAGAL